MNRGSAGAGTALARGGNGALSSGVPRILAVEDDEGLAEILTRALGAGDYELTVANRGQRGLELAAVEEFSLVILDLLLPDTDGISLLQQLMALRPMQEVLVVSALSNVEAKVRCLDLGAADYLAKPYALDELVARVRARVRRPRHGRGSDSGVLGRGALALDVQRRTARVDGRVVDLSAREFFVLEHLLRREGAVCTREEILESVWGYTHDPGTNVVDVYIRRLRKKIGGIPIETIRNVGYGIFPS